MLKYSYKRIKDTLPDFDLEIDKANEVLFSTTLKASFKWMAAVTILIKETTSNTIKLTINKDDIVYFDLEFKSEDDVVNALYEHINDMREIAEIENLFS